MRIVDINTSKLFDTLLDENEREIIFRTKCHCCPNLYDKLTAVCRHVYLSVFNNKGANADKMGMTRIVSSM